MKRQRCCFSMGICIIERQFYTAAVLGLHPSSAGPTKRCGECTREGGERLVLYRKRRDGARGSWDAAGVEVKKKNQSNLLFRTVFPVAHAEA